MFPDFKALRRTSHPPTGWKDLVQPGINLSWPLESMRGKCLKAFQDVVGCMQIGPPKIPSFLLLLLKIWVYFLFPWIQLGLVTCFSCFNFCPCQNATEMMFWNFWAWDLRDNFFSLLEVSCGLKTPTTSRSTHSEAPKQGTWKSREREKQGTWLLTSQWTQALKSPQGRPAGNPPSGPTGSWGR